MSREVQRGADQDRFGWVPLAVLKRDDLTSADKVVYAVISMHCGRQGDSWRIGQKILAMEARVSPKQVGRSIKKLREWGLLETTGQGKALRYTLGNGNGSDSQRIQEGSNSSDKMTELIRQDDRADRSECPRDHKRTSTKNKECMHGVQGQEATEAIEALKAINFDHPERFVQEHGIRRRDVAWSRAVAAKRPGIHNLPGFVRRVLADGERAPADYGHVRQPAHEAPKSFQQGYLKKRGDS